MDTLLLAAPLNKMCSNRGRPKIRRKTTEFPLVITVNVGDLPANDCGNTISNYRTHRLPTEINHRKNKQ